jgi:hypothetical protein
VKFYPLKVTSVRKKTMSAADSYAPALGLRYQLEQVIDDMDVIVRQVFPFLIKIIFEHWKSFSLKSQNIFKLFFLYLNKKKSNYAFLYGVIFLF